MRLLLSIFLAVAFFALPGCSKSKEGKNFTHVADDDQAMKDAIARAKATSGDFLQAFRAHKTGTADFYLKKPYRTPSGGDEHMWIEITGETDGTLTGVIANEAEETREVKNGQKVTLKLSEISDWKYTDGKKLMGGYTIRYFVDRMSPKEREAFLKESGLEL